VPQGERQANRLQKYTLNPPGEPVEPLTEIHADSAHGEPVWLGTAVMGEMEISGASSIQRQ